MQTTTYLTPADTDPTAWATHTDTSSLVYLSWHVLFFIKPDNVEATRAIVAALQEAITHQETQQEGEKP